MHYSDYRSSNQPGGAAAVSGSSGAPGATAGPGTPSSLAPGSRAGCYDPRPPSRLSHNSYAQFNTFSRAGQSQQPPPSSGPQTGDFPPDCSLLDSTPQLAYDNYSYHSHYSTYRMGFAPPSLAPLEGGPAYEMYSVGPSVGAGGTTGTPETGLGKYGSSTRFSYTSQHSDYSHRHTQRMQTHVWAASPSLLITSVHTHLATCTYTYIRGGSERERTERPRDERVGGDCKRREGNLFYVSPCLFLSSRSWQRKSQSRWKHTSTRVRSENLHDAENVSINELAGDADWIASIEGSLWVCQCDEQKKKQKKNAGEVVEDGSLMNGFFNLSPHLWYCKPKRRNGQKAIWQRLCLVPW